MSNLRQHDRLRMRFAVVALSLALAALVVAPGEVSAKTVKGVASYVGASYGSGYLALPEHKWHSAGIRVLICGPAHCIKRTSTDAGPDLAMQRLGRVADLSKRDFGIVCGCNAELKGTVKVTVYYLSASKAAPRVKPAMTLPPTDTKENHDAHSGEIGSQVADGVHFTPRGWMVPS